MLLCVSSMLTAGAHSQAASPSEDLQTMLWEQMSNCWASVSDLPEPSRLRVMVYAEFARNGTLKQEPTVVHPTEIADGDEAMQEAVRRAVRAVKKCAPYDFPAEHYAIWQNITFNFQYKPKEALSVS